MGLSTDKRRVLRGLWTAAWQHRGHTLAALALLLLAKLAGITVPLILKAIVDRFSRPEALRGDMATPADPVVLVLPVFLLLSYALLRFTGTLFTELRDLVFAPVTRATVAAV